MVITRFKAIFNIFTKELQVKYGDTITSHTFTDEEEWTEVSYDGDVNHPNYLSIQIDYDECFQLLFYPKKDGDESLNEDLMTSFNSSDMLNISKQLKICFTDAEFNEAKSFLNV